MYVQERSVSYRSTYTTHTDRCICTCVIDLSHICLPILHIQIDLFVSVIDLSHIALPILHIQIDVSVRVR